MKLQKCIGKMGRGRLSLLLGTLLCTAGVGATPAVSNAIEYDTNLNEVNLVNLYPSAYLMENAVRISIDWSSPIVPPLAERAIASLASIDRVVNEDGKTGKEKKYAELYPRKQGYSVTRPSDGGTSVLEIPLFTGTVPPRDAVIRIDMVFRTAQGTTDLASYSTVAIVAKGSFGAATILTVPETSGRWSLLQQPVDVHFCSTWWDAAPTYASIENVKEGVTYKGVAPLNGPARVRGVFPLDNESSGPGAQKKVRIYAGNFRLQEVEFHGGGMLIICR